MMYQIKKHIRNKSKTIKNIVIYIMVFHLFVLSGCSDEKNISSTVIANDENYFDEYTIPLDNDFDQLIEDNPIDKEYVWSDSGSVDRITFAVKYCETWEAEIEHTIGILKNYLSPGDYQSIILAYEGWKQYTQNTKLIEQNIFYIGGGYLSKENMPTGDGNTYPRVMEITAARTKNYAVQLMSLEYALTGKVEFVFRSIEDSPEGRLNQLGVLYSAQDKLIQSHEEKQVIEIINLNKANIEKFLAEETDQMRWVSLYEFDFSEDGDPEIILSKHYSEGLASPYSHNVVYEKSGNILMEFAWGFFNKDMEIFRSQNTKKIYYIYDNIHVGARNNIELYGQISEEKDWEMQLKYIKWTVQNDTEEFGVGNKTVTFGDFSKEEELAIWDGYYEGLNPIFQKKSPVSNIKIEEYLLSLEPLEKKSVSEIGTLYYDQGKYLWEPDKLNLDEKMKINIEKIFNK